MSAAGEPVIGSLCSGYGGLELGVQRVYGGRIAWHADIDRAANKVLAHNYPAVPNLGDITEIDWRGAEPVDILCAGFPCTDLSLAGKRAGLMPGTRSGIWSHVARAIDELRPPLVVIENVRGLLSAKAHSDLEPCPWCLGDAGTARHLRALGAVLGDLAERGYDARWHGLFASGVGAPHPRYRVFITARPAVQDADRAAVGQRRQPASGQAPGGRSWADARGRGRASAADADGDAVRLEPVAVAERGGAAVAGCDRAEAAADSDGDGLARRQHAADASGRPSDAARRGAAADRRADRAAADTDEPRSQGAGLGRSAGPSAVRDGARAASAAGAAAADTESIRRPQGLAAAEGQPGRSDARSGRAVADVDWREYEPAIRRWERITGHLAPCPTVTGARGQPKLSPYFVEWVMDLPPGWVTAVPGLTLNDMLRVLGNGVLQRQCAAALEYLSATELLGESDDRIAAAAV